MIRVVDASGLETVTVPYEGAEMSMTAYLGRWDSMERGPQAFVVDVAEECTIVPHFHPIDQFQVFARGRAIGKIPIRGELTVFYTDGFTPYGPITSDGDGLKFFNLRPRADLDLQPMPGSRDKLHRRAGRKRTAYLEPAAPSAHTLARRTTLIEPEEDGLVAYDTIAGGGSLLPDDIAGGAGRYEFVVTGTLELDDGRALGPESVLHASSGERLPVRRAGQEGVRVLSLQAPFD